MKKVLVLLFVVLSAVGCSQSRGILTVERNVPTAEGRSVTETITVRTPDHPNAPGSLSITPDGAVIASTGSEPVETPNQRSLGRLPLYGTGLLLLGVLLIAVKLKFPLVPAELGIGVALVGLLLIVLPSIIEAYLGYIVLGLVGAAAAVTVARVNGLHKKIKQTSAGSVAAKAEVKSPGPTIPGLKEE